MKNTEVGKMENLKNTANDHIAKVESGVEKLNTMFDELDAGIKADQAMLSSQGRVWKRRFSPNDVLASFMESIMDEERCRAWLIRRLHGADWSCPGCSRPVNSNLLARYFDGGRIKCSACGTFFTALSGTFLSGVHFNCRQIIVMYFMMSQGIFDKQISETVGINIESVRLWRKKLNDDE
jgi:transposase-like protein